MARILIVEDEREIATFLERGLAACGYAMAVARDGERARAMILADEFDLMILDMGLPKLDGLGVLRDVRASGGSLPVIVLTGQPGRDVVACLDEGADDYMRKPFRFEELLARVRTQLRPKPGAQTFVLTAGELRLDLRTRRAFLGERTVDLTAREFTLLETFVEHLDQVLSRQQLLSTVWGYYFDPGTNLVGTYVYSLRKKLGADVIETVRGVGYRVPRTLAAPASEA
jgi:DNA-binding response OmpR family regulator